MTPQGKTTATHFARLNPTAKITSFSSGRMDVSDTDSVELTHSVNSQDDDDLTGPLAPVPDRLSCCATICHGALYASRAIGSAMLSTGFTANICRHMMNKPTAKFSENLLMGLGVITYLTGTIGSASTVSGLARQESIQQSLKDAVVPAIVSFSVYLALAHGDI